jgi:phytoene/squalene synthetase
VVCCIQEELYRGVVSEPLKDVALAVAAVARAHLRHAQEMASKLPAPAAHMMLPAVMAGFYLEALEKAGFNVLDPSLAAGGVSPLRYLLALKWHYWRGTF